MYIQVKTERREKEGVEARKKERKKKKKTTRASRIACFRS